MRVAFVGGGTGGHLAPGIGVAEILRSEGHETLFLVAGREVERAMLEPRGLPSRSLFEGEGGRPAFLRLDAWLRATRRLHDEVGRFDPDVVVVLGGWVALPAVWTRFGRRPTVLIESNARPGRVQRLLARRIDHACLAVDGPDMPRGRRTTDITGAPTPRLALPSREQAAARFGLDPGRRTLLVTGGSQGARDLNVLVPALRRVLAERPEPWQVLHVTGHAADRLAVPASRESGADPGSDLAGVPLLAVPFVDDMAAAWALADAAVCRAGAGTVAELASTGTPAVLVPYPHHADRHQAHNAELLVRAGAAFMTADDDPTGARSAPDLLRRLLANLPAMAQRARGVGRPDAARLVASIVRAAAQRGASVVALHPGPAAEAPIASAHALAGHPAAGPEPQEEPGPWETPA